MGAAIRSLQGERSEKEPCIRLDGVEKGNQRAEMEKREGAVREGRNRSGQRREGPKARQGE